MVTAIVLVLTHIIHNDPRVLLGFINGIPSMKFEFKLSSNKLNATKLNGH